MAFDFTTECLGLVGLMIELFGLGFLFYELISSKKNDHKADALNRFRQGLESQMVGLQIQTSKSFADVTKLMGQMLSLSKGGVISDEAIEVVSQRLMEASNNLMTEEKLRDLQSKEITALAGIVEVFEEQNASAIRLKRLAAIGIGLVLSGAFLQILDLTFF